MKGAMRFLSVFLIFLLFTSISVQQLQAYHTQSQSMADTDASVTGSTRLSPSLPLPSIIPDTPAPSTELTVTFLDVGQADCTIIQYGSSSMIIDAGGNSTASSLVTTIENMGITGFDVVIGTHPHEDHIGGLDAVINNFEIGTIYMPDVTHTTRTFEDVLTAIENKGLNVTIPVPGDTFTLDQDVQCTILAPNNSSYPDLNSHSIVLKMVYGDTSFLFTGDAEMDSEREMLDKGFDLDADVLKVGHHGSTSSTSQDFLDAVSPEYVVIFVGEDNIYGHPHQETLDKLNAAGIEIYRTDLHGTIVFTSDGTNLNVTTNAIPATPSLTATPPFATSPPVPPPSSPGTGSSVRITGIFYDGLVPKVESDEYVEITNQGSLAVDLNGWVLRDISDGKPSFTFPAYSLQPGESIRVYTNEIHPEYGGFSFGSESSIWSNSEPDVAALFDSQGQEVSRESY